MTTAGDAGSAGTRVTLLAAVLLAGAGLLAFGNGLTSPLIFDDLQTVQGNEYIRHLWPPGRLFGARERSALSGRPLVSATLAINYALGGTSPIGYHIFNLLVHVLNGIVLFAIVRRTLGLPRLRARFGTAAPVLALVVATVWLVHPLTTESVTYVTQRTESLVALFYLLTLACALRAWDGPRAAAWSAASVLCCALGVFTKDVIVFAPVVVVLHDWTMREEGWREILARRARLYAGLAATWSLLALSLVLIPREAGQGFGHGMSAWHYACTQAVVVMRYLGLALWPRGLCLDHGLTVPVDVAQVVGSALVLATLCGATAWALWRRRPVGFLGAWFFLILAPTSSFIPIVLEPMAERRMYLPLIAVVALAVLGAYAVVAGRAARAVRLAGAVATAAVILCLGLLTVRRNADYASVSGMWRDVVRQVPANPRGHLNLGMADAAEGRDDEATGEFQEAIRLKPDYVEALNDLAVAMVRRGRVEEGLARLHEAVRARPDHPLTYYNLAAVLRSSGRIDEAIEAYEQAVRLNPDFVAAHVNLGSLLSEHGRLDEAIAHYRQALRLDPTVAEAHYDLGNALSQQGDLPGAIEAYTEALRLRPTFTQAQTNLDGARTALAQRPAP